MESEFYTEDGDPKKCQSCGSTEFKTIVMCTAGDNLPAEVEYFCVSCNSAVAYWACGAFDPFYYREAKCLP